MLPHLKLQSSLPYQFRALEDHNEKLTNFLLLFTFNAFRTRSNKLPGNFLFAIWYTQFIFNEIPLGYFTHSLTVWFTGHLPSSCVHSENLPISFLIAKESRHSPLLWKSLENWSILTIYHYRKPLFLDANSLAIYQRMSTDTLEMLQDWNILRKEIDIHFQFSFYIPDFGYWSSTWSFEQQFSNLTIYF